MKVLVIHQNFPGQFKHLVPALTARGDKVLGMTIRRNGPNLWGGAEVCTYLPQRGSSPNIHPWVADLETKIIRAEACLHQALKIKDSGFYPDLILAHHGWGESLFLKEVWPNARLGIYCEFFYLQQGADIGFDPEFPTQNISENCRIRLKNLNNLLHFDLADGGISPTKWQANTFPNPMRRRISVIHDGINTRIAAPNCDAIYVLPNGERVKKKDEVVTFINRNLEPYRGYHIFMRALPRLLRERPGVKILIVGGDGVSYGSKPTDGRSWKDKYINEVRGAISDDDWSRVYFLGNLPYESYLALLQVSTVHVYLTYPFVLSWSLLEAMSVGCAIVASDTPPVREVISSGDNGVLVDFFSNEALVASIIDLLDQPRKRELLGAFARQHVVENFDLQNICLPRQINWIDSLCSA